ncbi:hypothetical protein EVAR_95169_1 [Eumeta japonica]|uniref:Uncharacterized protein n=1 Tax=Eumeta variegata TaxID=151549 RepID=A0A4C1VJE8_EUMVA|nr:hypothetical protein EVAR_95169_1 [Eumeta japonica]
MRSARTPKCALSRGPLSRRRGRRDLDFSPGRSSLRRRLVNTYPHVARRRSTADRKLVLGDRRQRPPPPPAAPAPARNTPHDAAAMSCRLLHPERSSTSGQQDVTRPLPRVR